MAVEKSHFCVDIIIRAGNNQSRTKNNNNAKKDCMDRTKICIFLALPSFFSFSPWIVFRSHFCPTCFLSLFFFHFSRKGSVFLMTNTMHWQRTEMRIPVNGIPIIANIIQYHRPPGDRGYRSPYPMTWREHFYFKPVQKLQKRQCRGVYFCV